MLRVPHSLKHTRLWSFEMGCSMTDATWYWIIVLSFCPAQVNAITLATKLVFSSSP